MENQTKKEVVFSAIQPSGTITLGNYLGAVRNWVTMQNEYNCIYALADLHTITVRQTPAVMRKNIIDAYASIMACGIDVEKKVNLISKEERHQFVHLMKNFTWTITRLRDFNEAIITKGGVKVKEINPSTMESKLVSGLYFVGEVLDLDALTGGFNLQIAWSTGYLAGISAAQPDER